MLQQSTSEALSVNTYDKREGGNDNRGGRYEIHLIISLLLKAVQRNDIFYLGSNVNKLGNFDDVCFKHLFIEEWHLMLFQLKHKQKSNEPLDNNFFYTLLYKSYKSHINEIQDYPNRAKNEAFANVKEENINIFIYTNGALPKDVRIRVFNLNQFAHYLNTNNAMVAFQIDESFYEECIRSTFNSIICDDKCKGHVQLMKSLRAIFTNEKVENIVNEAKMGKVMKLIKRRVIKLTLDTIRSNTDLQINTLFKKKTPDEIKQFLDMDKIKISDDEIKKIIKNKSTCEINNLLDMDEMKHHLNKDRFKKFLNKLIMCPNQPDEECLKNYIHDELAEMCDEANVATVFNDIYLRIEKWYENKEQPFSPLSNERLHETLQELDKTVPLKTDYFKKWAFNNECYIARTIYSSDGEELEDMNILNLKETKFPIIIADELGQGKTTLIDKLSQFSTNDIKIISIRLYKFKDLEGIQVDSDDSITCRNFLRKYLMYNNEKRYDKILQYTKNHHFFLLLDGHNELIFDGDDTKKKADKIFKVLSDKFNVVFTTTQSYKFELQQLVNGKIYYIRKFVKNEQKQLIRNFFVKLHDVKLNINDKKLIEIVDQIYNILEQNPMLPECKTFFNNPLHLKMFLEQFKENFADYYFNKKQIAFYDIHNLFDLYKQFVDSIIDRYLDRYGFVNFPKWKRDEMRSNIYKDHFHYAILQQASNLNDLYSQFVDNIIDSYLERNGNVHMDHLNYPNYKHHDRYFYDGCLNNKNMSHLDSKCDEIVCRDLFHYSNPHFHKINNLFNCSNQFLYSNINSHKDKMYHMIMKQNKQEYKFKSGCHELLEIGLIKDISDEGVTLLHETYKEFFIAFELQKEFDKHKGEIIGHIICNTFIGKLLNSKFVFNSAVNFNLLDDSIESFKQISNYKKDCLGRTPLHIAVMIGASKVRDYLIQQKRYLHDKDDINMSVLLYAIIYRQIETAEKLIALQCVCKECNTSVLYNRIRSKLYGHETSYRSKECTLIA